MFRNTSVRKGTVFGELVERRRGLKAATFKRGEVAMFTSRSGKCFICVISTEEVCRRMEKSSVASSYKDASTTLRSGLDPSTRHPPTGGGLLGMTARNRNKFGMK